MIFWYHSHNEHLNNLLKKLKIYINWLEYNDVLCYLKGNDRSHMLFRALYICSSSKLFRFFDLFGIVNVAVLSYITGLQNIVNWRVWSQVGWRLLCFGTWTIFGLDALSSLSGLLRRIMFIRIYNCSSHFSLYHFCRFSVLVYTIT